MKWHERLAMVRRYGPPSPTLRHVLEVLTSYDDDEGRYVWPGNQRLAAETGISCRHIRRALADLVRAGWLKPEREAQESRPSGREGMEAWWAHGNLGGRKNSTRYRVIYRTETLTPCPQQRGQGVRVPNSADSKTLTPCPQTLTPCPNNPDTVSGDPPLNNKEQSGGDTPPTPPGEVGPAVAGPQGAGAPVWSAAARHAIQSAAKRGGADIQSTASMEAWEGILADLGIESDQFVNRALFDLANAYESEFKQKPIRPYLASDLAPFVPIARRRLDAIRALHARTTKATA